MNKTNSVRDMLDSQTTGYYLTREGSIVRIFDFKPNLDFCAFGRDVESGAKESYTENGRWSTEEEDDRDLVRFLGAKFTDI